MIGDFIEESVYHGLEFGEFGELTKRQKRGILKLLSRVSEKSYRRGFQHGKALEKTVNPAHLRFNVSLTRSPFTDVFYKDGAWAKKSGYSSEDRFLMEYPDINNIGLRI